ncbi:hypothetical protein AC1031_001732 [Aphanomyces cochlioides]|nr:hypothetical protein AC1031_001732 [Aphanomyces cochlioides]
MENLLCLPSSLQVLDVSYNELAAMENINWNYFPNLTTLILQGNAIASMRNTSFPSTLTTLDLSDNPLASVVLSKATVTQLNGLPSLSTHTTTQHVDLQLNNFEFNGCGVQDIKYLGENVVCVETNLSSIESAAASTAGYLVGIVVLFAVLMGGGAFYLSKQRRRDAELAMMQSRETSACFDGVASPTH